MQFNKIATSGTLAAATLMSFATIANANTPGQMMQECRIRAHEVLHTRLPNIETKYEGQRTDGTHAVNGTAWIRGRTETFQCSFNPRGRRIIQFVVNQPGGTGGGASAESESEPSTREERVRFPSGQTGVDYKEQLGSGSSVRYLLNARNGQFLYVRVATGNPRTYFNIFTPDGNTLYESVRAGNEYRGQLWLNGDHVVEVYNRSRQPAQYTVTFEIRRR
jgi:hypothetical protein